MSDLRKTKFGVVLARNNKQIRDDRALSIIEDAEMIYKRVVENLEKDLRVLRREREAMLDLSPGNSYSLKMESFDADLFVKKYQELGLSIREVEIKLEVAKNSYDDLFADDSPMSPAPDVTASVN